MVGGIRNDCSFYPDLALDKALPSGIAQLFSGFLVLLFVKGFDDHGNVLSEIFKVL